MAIIYIKDATRDKVEDIADAKRWSRATLIEVAIDEYIDRHGIERPDPAQAASGRETSN